MDSFVFQYLETALWSSTDDDDRPLDQIQGNWTVEEFLARETIDRAELDCKWFQVNLEIFDLWDEALEYASETSIAHNFWLTRNGHGAGFWDGDFGDIGNDLTEIADRFWEVNLYIGDDGKVYS